MASYLRSTSHQGERLVLGLWFLFGLVFFCVGLLLVWFLVLCCFLVWLAWSCPEPTFTRECSRHCGVNAGSKGKTSTEETTQKENKEFVPKNPQKPNQPQPHDVPLQQVKQVKQELRQLRSWSSFATRSGFSKGFVASHCLVLQIANLVLGSQFGPVLCAL